MHLKLSPTKLALPLNPTFPVPQLRVTNAISAAVKQSGGVWLQLQGSRQQWALLHLSDDECNLLWPALLQWRHWQDHQSRLSEKSLRVTAAPTGKLAATSIVPGV